MADKASDPNPVNLVLDGYVSREEVRKDILQRAASVPKAKWGSTITSGFSCSNCKTLFNRHIGPGLTPDFCPCCGATFLTDEQIRKGELNSWPKESGEK